jgi:membrane-associated phospholipid phosphatase
MAAVGMDRRAPALLVGSAAALALALVPAAADAVPTPVRAGPGSPAITRWITLDLQQIAAHRVNPPRAARGLALVSVAMYRAVRRAPRREQAAAIAGAASSVLVYLCPDQAAPVRRLAERAAHRRTRGLAVGRRIGARVVRRALRDGSGNAWHGEVPTGPEFWAPTPPAYQPMPLEPLAGTWRPWNMRSALALRPAPPPRPESEQFGADLLEVYRVSRSLTDEQKRIAAFWADGPGTATPPGHWNQIAVGLVTSHHLPAASAAEIFAALNTAQGDAFICAWDAKYAYWSVRPVTAIRRELDPNWSPYLVTPPFPSYVSGHATTSGAASEVLAGFFPGEAGRLRAWAREAALSRLYAGIHFRTDNRAGLVLGRKVAVAALAAARSGALWLRP